MSPSKDSKEALSPEPSVAAPPRRELRLVAALCVVLALVLAADLALCYAFLPSEGKTKGIWWRYYQHKDDPIDTLIVGTSYAMQCIDGARLDEARGTHTFSLATPNQSPEATLIAIEDAYEDHHIKNVIIGVSIESVQASTRDVPYDVAFALGEAQGRPLTRAASTYLRTALGGANFGSVGSLAALAPWSVWNVGLTPSAARQNVQAKRSLTQEQMEEEYRYVFSNGFAPVGGKVNIKKVARYASAASPQEYELDEGLMEGYRKVCRWCAARDIDVCFVTIPWLPYLLIRYDEPGGYALAVKPFVDAMAAEGADFLDCALLRADYFVSRRRVFYNEQHLNTKGSQYFSKVLADVLARRDAGEDVTPYFYGHDLAGWDEYLHSVKGLSIATFEATPRAGAIDLAMKGFSGADYTIEYEVQVKNAAGEYEVVRPYSTEETYALAVEGHGVADIRLLAREVGSKRWANCVCTREVLY